MIERDAKQRIMMALGYGIGRLFNNPVGQVQDQRSGQWIKYGLCVGSSDLIGWRSVEITPDMVGRRVAVFTAVEAKSDTGRLTAQQTAFLDAVRAAGGIGIMARSADEAVAGVEKYVDGR